MPAAQRRRPFFDAFDVRAGQGVCAGRQFAAEQWLRITATATDANGSTSEFSACTVYTNDTVFSNGFNVPPAG